MLALAVAAAVAAPSLAQAERRSVINGSCRYSPQVAKYQHDTALILCDTVTISSTPTGATFEFGRRSWGATAGFSGTMTGKRMTISRISIRGGEPREATGTCEVFHRSDGKLSVIGCLGYIGRRSFAVNFEPSRL